MNIWLMLKPVRYLNFIMKSSKPKEEIARKMGYDLIDHWLELYGKKIKE